MGLLKKQPKKAKNTKHCYKRNIECPKIVSSVKLTISKAKNNTFDSTKHCCKTCVSVWLKHRWEVENLRKLKIYETSFDKRLCRITTNKIFIEQVQEFIYKNIYAFIQEVYTDFVGHIKLQPKLIFIFAKLSRNWG